MAERTDTDHAGTNGAQSLSHEALEAKLKGKPDFVLEECYCKGVGEYCVDNAFCVQLAARAKLPTRFGTFTLYGFYDNREGKEHTAIVHGDVEGMSSVPLRVHSECHTGDVWGSLRCDCRDQLEAATRYIAGQPCGVVIYLKQEGRGIGLLNKIRAYQLQELGLDTVEANQYLNLPVDARDYRVAAKIIRLLKIRSVMLLTNNPDKIEQLKQARIDVEGRIPIVIPANSHDEGYLEVKKNKMGHLI
ncbi:MAG TPA: GTP cyclohydrolase II [Spirochaetia bacterium]|nr:GTP cyclohydrolase II [Spirochaetia bacterium]